jgi:Cu(I)/Ag(I) efflux system membrane protein CusA/SilA
MINSVIEFSVKNRFLVILAFLVIIGLGIYALMRTPIDAIPDLSENQQTIFTAWPGVTPQDIEDQITYPLSVNLQGLAGVKAVRSASDFGFSMVNVIFEEDVDYYFARERIIERLSLAATFLPSGVTPYLAPDATAMGQVFWYTVEGEGYDLAQLRAVQDWYVRYQLNAVPGVAEVASVGGFIREYQVDVDPNKLLAYGIPLKALFSNIARSNKTVGAKVIERNDMEYLIRGTGWIKSIEDIENIVLGSKAGVPVYVKNVARVALGPGSRRGILEKNGSEVTGGVVIMRYGQDPLTIIKRIKEKIKEIEPGLPPGVKIVPFYDRTDLIHKALATLRKSLTQQMVIAVICVLIFLLHFRSSFVVSLMLPLAIIISFIFMYYLHIPSNIMSLSGIAISIGVLVDAGVVVTENVFRHLTEKSTGAKVKGDIRPVAQAAAKEVGRPIFFSVLIMLLSFVPVFMLSGMEGKMFHPLAYTRTFAMVGTAVLAVTLVPALASLFVKGRLRSEEENPFVRFAMAVYGPFLRAAIRHKHLTIITMILAVIVTSTFLPYGPMNRWANEAIFFSTEKTLQVASRIFSKPGGFLQRLSRIVDENKKAGHKIIRPLGSEFMPPLDEGSILDMPVTLPSVSLDRAVDDLKTRNAIIRSFPEVALVVGKAGRAETPTDPAPVEMIETIVSLKPREDWPKRVKREWRIFRLPLLGPYLEKRYGRRPLTMQELIWGQADRDGKIEIPGLEQVVNIPGWKNIWTKPIQNRVDMLATGIRTEVGAKIFGSDLEKVAALAQEVAEVIKTVPGAANVVPDTVQGENYLEIDIDRKEAARYGINIGDVHDVIEVALGGKRITMTTFGRERFPVRVRYARELRDNIQAINRILIPTPSPSGQAGAQIPLAQLARLRITQGPTKIKSENGLLVAYVLFNAAGRDVVGLVEEADRRVKEEINFPAGHSIQWSGQYEHQIRAKKTLSLILPVVLFIMFVILYLTYNSFSDALIIMLALPGALTGGFILQYIFGYDFSVAVWVGYITCFGAAVETGIVMVVFLRQAIAKKGVVNITKKAQLTEAIMEGACLRLRPKLLTESTTILALLPMLWATGVGAEIMRPLAVPVIGGVITSDIVILIVIPVLYHWLKEWTVIKKNRKNSSLATRHLELG